MLPSTKQGGSRSPRQRAPVVAASCKARRVQTKRLTSIDPTNMIISGSAIAANSTATAPRQSRTMARTLDNPVTAAAKRCLS